MLCPAVAGCETFEERSKSLRPSLLLIVCVDVMNAMAKSRERIYSSQQLAQALRSAVNGVREQLGVLAVLDGTASSWPGVNQAVDDMEVLIDMSAQTNTRWGGACMHACMQQVQCLLGDPESPGGFITASGRQRQAAGHIDMLLSMEQARERLAKGRRQDAGRQE